MPANFFDTNVVLYLASADEGKAAISDSLLKVGGVISVQVLNEIMNVARRKMKLSWPETRSLLSGIRSLLEVRPILLATHERGVDLAERYGLSTYDAMIVSAALEADCDVLWSEDMQDGMLVAERLRIINPFNADNLNAI